MSKPEVWVPLAWPSGPLAIALSQTATEDRKQACETWHKPDALGLLDGTPFNCIVVNWAAGNAADASQQTSLGPLIAAAKAKSIAVVGRIAGAADAGCAAAKQAGLDAVLVETAPRSSELPVIYTAKAEEVEDHGSAPVVALGGAVWPRIPMKAGGGEGGPTGAPWIDSNGWAVQLLQGKLPRKMVWVLAEPPDDAPLWRAEAYMLAVADASATGARWPVHLKDEFRRELAAGQERAVKNWKRIAETVRFFEGRMPVCSLPVGARLGVISDYAGANAFTANEVLNLAARRLLQYKVIDKPRLTAADLRGLKAALWIDENAPSGGALKLLADFVEAGNLLIVPASAAALADGLKPAARQETSYAIYGKGQGRIAVAKEPWSDPWVLAADAHLLLSRRHDMVRLWNSGASTVRYTESEGRGVLHIVNFAGRQGASTISAWVAQPFRTARFVTSDSGAAQALEVREKAPGIEVNLPPFSVYAAVEFGA